MLVFIDESGDSGFKFGKGSSEIFTIVLVVFNEKDEAKACDTRIELLKREIFGSKKEEFHFKRNSDKVRKLFFEAMIPYNFFYYGFVLNKKNLYGEGFRSKESFYKIISGYIFENAKEKLDNAKIIIDKNGNNEFRNSLAKYLKIKINDSSIKRIKEVKMQESHKNNLLQLADYVASGLNRFYNTGKIRSEYEYIKKISSKEIYVQVWPK
ncbi:MAG: DUF3800 domain-containing protein [Candidatus Gracilibacteria bacterium]|nr:DUF3800 domain-containing protein [Candidatus Gracilibacteria bacterium]